jgi:hypothetical protein
MLLLSEIFTIFPTPDMAQAVVDAMLAIEPDTDGWTYKVQLQGTGTCALIIVYDEDENRMGAL